MDWLDIASLPLAAGIIVAFGYVFYRIFKVILESLVKPICETMEETRESIKSCTEAQTNALVTVVTNHIQHSEMAWTQVSQSLDKLAEKLDRDKTAV
ncbi:MAG: hypothetical protein WC565_07145 [Parcubacteria group bacterium]